MDFEAALRISSHGVFDSGAGPRFRQAVSALAAPGDGSFEPAAIQRLKTQAALVMRELEEAPSFEDRQDIWHMLPLDDVPVVWAGWVELIDALEAAQLAGLPPCPSGVLAQVAQRLELAGDQERARRYARSQLKTLGKLGDLTYHYLKMAHEVLARSAPADEALHHALRAFQLAHGTGLEGYDFDAGVLLHRALVESGQPDLSRALARYLAPTAEVRLLHEEEFQALASSIRK